MNIFDIKSSKYTDYEELNQYILKDPKQIVLESEDLYNKNIESLAKLTVNANKEAKFIMLSGPSGSGKTITAAKLKSHFDKLGKGAVIISLDNFYKEISQTPKLPNGESDFESINALDVSQIQQCLQELFVNQECYLPIFSFEKRKTLDQKEYISIKNDQIIILEGLHALNPILRSNLPGNRFLTISLDVKKYIKSSDTVMLSGTDIRFLRRLVRDYKFRNASAQLTVSMWTNVCNGEIKYIRPYTKTASFAFNSFFPYELSVLKNEALRVLNDGTLDFSKHPKIQILKDFLPFIVDIDKKLVPTDSLLREFIGRD